MKALALQVLWYSIILGLPTLVIFGCWYIAKSQDDAGIKERIRCAAIVTKYRGEAESSFNGGPPDETVKFHLLLTLGLLRSEILDGDDD